MEETGKPSEAAPGAIDVPESVQEEARNIVTCAFQLFSDHNQRLADDLLKFNQKRRQVQETIERGARRTTGRIV